MQVSRVSYKMSYYNFNHNLPMPYKVIHPLQVNAVRKLLSNEMPEGLEMLVLFGSSLDLTCNPASDLDLAIIHDDKDADRVKEAMHKICQGVGRPFDLLSVSREDLLNPEFGSIEYHIMQRCVVLYAKE